MGIQHLMDFISTQCQDAVKPVDLIRIARGFATKKRKGGGPARLCLVVDAESCLDRLYGGFFSDWVCGGQWSRMMQFLNNLMRACHSANMELVVFFNGALESQRMDEWYRQQVEEKKKVLQVLKHVHNKATPPPKIWWVPPVCLGVCLRMALRQLGVSVACSMDDHHQEVIAYCRENNFHGLLAQDADYAIFDPPRYFSSHNLKLTYKGTLETQEYIMDEVAKSLDLNPKRFCVFAALLGNHILPEEDLKEFFQSLLDLSPHESVLRIPQSRIIRAVVSFVRGLATVDDLDEVGQAVFRSVSKDVETKMDLFKQSVQYYLNGTKEGFLKYKPKIQLSTPTKQPGSYPSKNTAGPSAEPTATSTPTDKKEEVSEEGDGDAKDGDDADIKADSVYTEGESGYANSQLSAPEIVIDPPSTAQELENALASQLDKEDLQQRIEKVSLEGKEEEVKEEKKEKGEDKEEEEDSVLEVEGQLTADDSHKLGGTESMKLSSVSSSSSSSSGSSPSRLSPDTSGWSLKTLKTSQQSNKSANKTNGDHKASGLKVSHEIMRIASERHQKGLMSPWIYQTLSQGEVKISVCLEDDSGKDLPTAVEAFRRMRQAVYGVLFDLGKTKNPSKASQKVTAKDIVIKEWVVGRGNNGAKAKPELVHARGLEWNAPSINQLWLGQKIEHKNRRLRAFLSCMDSDSPLMLNTSYVPQHLLLMCCVLRYLVFFKDRRVLRRHELDAFLSQAVSPLLRDVETMQEMKLPMITTRGVQLASLFMQGVEAAIFANDACGAPIPWTLCCPWLFFDGKLFHFKLLKANNQTPLIDMCDGHMDQVVRVERMRQAVLEGMQMEFAKPSLPMMQPQHPQYGPPMYPPGMGFRPAGAASGPQGPPHPPHSRTAGRGRGLLGRSPVDSRGGQLQIAGVVVGSWGANTQAQPPRPGGRGTHVAPHIMAIGPRSRGGGPPRGMMAARGIRGRGMTRPMNLSRGPVYKMTAQKFYGGSSLRSANKSRRARGGQAVKVRGKSGQAQDMTKVTLEQRTKVEARGRGCTVESTSNGSSVVSVSQLMKSNSLTQDDDEDDEDEDEDEDDEDEEEEEMESDEEEETTEDKFEDAESDLKVGQEQCVVETGNSVVRKEGQIELSVHAGINGESTA